MPVHQVAGAALSFRCPVLCFLLAAWRRSGRLGGGEEKGSEGKNCGWLDGRRGSREGTGEAPPLAAGRARRRRREREAQSGRGDGGAEEKNTIAC